MSSSRRRRRPYRAAVVLAAVAALAVGATTDLGAAAVVATRSVAAGPASLAAPGSALTAKPAPAKPAPAKPAPAKAAASRPVPAGSRPAGWHQAAAISPSHALPLGAKVDDDADSEKATGPIRSVRQAFAAHAFAAHPGLGTAPKHAAVAPPSTATPTVGRAAAVPRAAAAPACDPAVSNPVVCENQLPGSPPSQWDLPAADGGDPTLQGFATDISANPGDTVHFKVKSTASAYRVDVYRLGWYGGNGARKVATFSPQVAYPQTQPTCLNDPSTGLNDCGNWAESASWAVPTTAVSGLYLAKLTRLDNGGASHIPFVVRNDSSHSDAVFQTDDSTWQAYNTYGGDSLYTGNGPGGGGRAYKVSYNRPIITRGVEGTRSYLMNDEVPAIRFLERNGYDLSYTTSVDTARRGSLLMNHKAFMSVGHDEYWSSEQRSSVEAARDAGINLMWLSGNEVYWKTRWENSIDGSNTAWRTIVTYKETKNTSPLDPMYPSVWTGTWRDPRYSPPADGGRPENALSGTNYQVDPPTDFALDISAQYAKLRMWRGTAVASLQPGQHKTLMNNTLGYEFDIDPDNGFRPAGEFDISGQVENVQAELQDYGSVVAPGTVTHHMTFYKAASGALVFSAGTIQFVWGLDDVHDGTATNQDPVMQQLVENVLADMKVQPKTRISTLVAASPSTDTTAPTSAVTSGGSATVASPYTVTGTAADGGGVVAGVEVSVDGSTWHPATGTTSWSYTFTPTAAGPVTVRERAVDDSGNLQAAVSAPLSVGSQTCPCTIFNTRTPTVPASSDTSSLELGVRWKPDISGTVTGVRFYKGTGNTGTHTGSLWGSDGSLLATGTFTGESTTGWQTLTFATPVAVTAGQTYVASYHTTTGHYAADTFFFSNNSVYSAPLLAMADGSGGSNGVFHQGASAYPTSSYQSTNYWVDVVFGGDTSTGAGAPTITSSNPAPGSTSIPVGSRPSVTFSKPFGPGSVRFTLSTGGATVPSTFTANASTLSAVLTPSSPLTPSTTYTGSVSATDTQGNPMPSPYTWTFTTGAAQPPAGTCPCSIWSDQQQPGTASTNDAGSIEVGVKLTASTSGYVTGIRYFKGAQNTGRHTGTLWSASGQQLATATFGTESTSGWQQVTFASAVAVTAGTTYVASYHTTTGYYASTSGYFASSGASYGPLTAPSSPVAGGNGVYAYSPSTTFPASTSGAANYWVDVVFTTSVPGATPPRVLSVSPAAGTTGASVGSQLSATFDRAVTGATLTVSTGGNAVPGQTTYNAGTNTVTFTPSAPLSPGATYSASALATGTDGTPMAAPYAWTFATANPSTCPCTLFAPNAAPAVASSSEVGAYELGVRFRSDIAGYVSGVRFYKGAANTGTHTGSLWSTAGALLATGTYAGETASGWQTLTFDAPVAVTANTDYIASYHMTVGHYAYDSGAFNADIDRAPLHGLASTTAAPNGVYAAGASAFPASSYGATNYWVDPVFATTATDTTPPHVTSTSPPSGGSGASTSTSVSATFSEAADPATLVMTLASPAGPVAGTSGYAAATRTATFTPSAALATATTYTAGVTVKDLAGNAMPTYTWTFTTLSSSSCPCSLLGTATPAHVDSGDAGGIELGVSFSSEIAGSVTGVRFYKATTNTGTHTGSLWGADGTVLATGTFSGETASGWQTLTFTTPVAVTAGTTYVVSYHTDAGHYSYDSAYFATQKDAPPLHAATPNGFYRAGASGFPTSTYNNTNYWVDVTFTSP